MAILPSDPLWPNQRVNSRLLDQYGLPLSRDDDQSGPVIPHPLTFGMVLNIIAKTYSYRWDEALRHLPQNALAMRRDCFIKALLQERKLPTVNRKWQLVPDDPGHPEQRQAADLLTKCVRKTRRWKRLLAYLLEASWYGRYAAQVTWEQQPIGGGVRAWCVGRHKPVNGDKIQFRWEGVDKVQPDDDVPAVFINAGAARRYPDEFVVYTDRVPALVLARPCWREQFIIHTHEVDDADYFEGEMAGAVNGVGLRNWIYWAWWLRDEMLSWAVDFMKKCGTLGLLVFWYQQGNKTAQAAAEENVQKSGKATALTMPRLDSKDTANGVEHIPLSMGGIELLRSMIVDYFEHHIERLVIGQTLSSDSEGSGLGGSGVAELHENTKFQLLQFDADNLAETLSDDLIGPMLRKNYPKADFGVRFEFMQERPRGKEIMDSVNTAVALGVSFKADEVRELTGLTKPAEGDETVGGKRDEGDGAPDDVAASQLERYHNPFLYAFDPAQHPRDQFGRWIETEWARGGASQSTRKRRRGGSNTNEVSGQESTGYEYRRFHDKVPDWFKDLDPTKSGEVLLSDWKDRYSLDDWNKLVKAMGRDDTGTIEYSAFARLLQKKPNFGVAPKTIQRIRPQARASGADNAPMGGGGNTAKGQEQADEKPQTYAELAVKRAIAQKNLVMDAWEVKHDFFRDKDVSTLPFYEKDILDDLNRIIDDGRKVFCPEVEGEFKKGNSYHFPDSWLPTAGIHLDIAQGKSSTRVFSAEKLKDYEDSLSSCRRAITEIQAIELAKQVDPTFVSPLADIAEGAATGNQEQVLSGMGGLVGSKLGGALVKRIAKRMRPRVPDAIKWKKEGGKVLYHADGSMTYTSNNGISITYGPRGSPEFSKHLYRGNEGRAEVKIRLTGDRKLDEIAANAAAGFKTTPMDYVWHHHEDPGVMQLVKRDVHEVWSHTGGFSINQNK
jgi:hypothetical protein